MPHSIHRQLAERYAGDPGLLEVRVARFVVDAVGAGGELVEIQTHGFHHLKPKLEHLLEVGQVVLVYPTALEKTIVKLHDSSDEVRSRRRSPRRGSRCDVLPEIRRIGKLLAHENLSLHIVITREHEVRRDALRGKHWRRKYEIIDRDLQSVVRTERYEVPTDWLRFVPSSLPRPFTNKSLAQALGVRPWQTQPLTKLLHEMRVVERVGRTREGLQYVVPDEPQPMSGATR